MSISPFQILLICTLLGGLAGVIVFLFKTLIEAKDQRIRELSSERDYYRSAALIERDLPLELHPNALPPGTALSTVAVAPPAKNPNEPGRFAYYSLLVQAVISIVIILGSFWIIARSDDPNANQFAYQLLSFTLGTWLGRGVDWVSKK